MSSNPRFLLCTCLFLSGCEQVRVTQNPVPVQVTGRLTGSSQPFTSVILNFQPTGEGLPGTTAVKNGRFSIELTPGQYTYYLTPAPGSRSRTAIPVAYREGSLERQIDISSETSLELAVNSD